jgi:hypothetical protein
VAIENTQAKTVYFKEIDRAPPSKSPSVEFIDENGGGPGVRLRKSTRRRARFVFDDAANFVT